MENLGSIRDKCLPVRGTVTGMFKTESVLDVFFLLKAVPDRFSLKI